MYETVKSLVDVAKRIVVIQPENPDADSLGSAVALEEMLGQMPGKSVSLFCAIDMPKYLHYIEGWARVNKDWDGQYDLAIIVDTSAEALLMKALATPGLRHFLETHPVLVIDHASSATGGTPGQIAGPCLRTASPASPRHHGMRRSRTRLGA